MHAVYATFVCDSPAKEAMQQQKSLTYLRLSPGNARHRLEAYATLGPAVIPVNIRAHWQNPFAVHEFCQCDRVGIGPHNFPPYQA
jgi:hypothetical protein